MRPRPKFLYWFIVSSKTFTLRNVFDLIASWDKIEESARDLYHQQIIGTIEEFLFSGVKMNVYARNLCVLYTHVFMSNHSGLCTFGSLPPQWMPFIEAGLIRVTGSPQKWILHRPNRFLVKIFNSYIDWFNWDSVLNLIANVKASEATRTLKGKVFEFLFALELCSPSDSIFWEILATELNIRPKLDWEPSTELISEVKHGMDQNKIHIMKDPDCSGSKTDVVFFAHKLKPGQNPVTVRVLCQLTTQSKSCKPKVKETFLAMQCLKGGLTDYRVFVSPNARGSLLDQNATVHRVTSGKEADYSEGQSNTTDDQVSMEGSDQLLEGHVRELETEGAAPTPCVEPMDPAEN